MAQQFTLIDNETKLPADVSNGHIFVSADQDNSTGTKYQSIRMVIDYKNLQSSDGTVGLQAVIEGKAANGEYYPIAYQFEDFRPVGFQQFREINLDPELVWFDPGIDNIVYVGNSTIGQISNQQGVLPETWRMCIRITDPNNTFQSVQLSAYGELTKPV
jgi:hypothetical protein